MQTLDTFELPNVGTGPDPLSLTALGRDHDSVLLPFQRDYEGSSTWGRPSINDLLAVIDEFG